MKESILKEEVRTFCYVPSKENPADKLTKFTLETPIFFNIFLNGLYDQKTRRKYVNLVKREHTFEIRLIENGLFKETN